MTRILILLCLYAFTFSVVAAQRPFITTWKTDNAGISCSSCITIPTFPGETYNYDVDWDNDGVYDDIGVDGDITHDYGVAGTYTVAIRGVFPRIYFNGSFSYITGWSSDYTKIIKIDQWGDIVWTSMEKAFQFCKALLTTGSDAPDLTNVTSTASMFHGAIRFDADLNSWDVSNITDMSGMFSGYSSFNDLLLNSISLSFNGNLSSWDVSSVTNMSNMFNLATRFNQDLSSWDVSSVTNMSNMFRAAVMFNGDIGSWDVSNVTSMSGMFSGHVLSLGNYLSSVETLFNRDISSWDVSNVKHMESMFFRAVNFNQDIGGWDVSSVISMDYMFSAAINFNQDIGGWDVSNVTNMSYMFSAYIGTYLFSSTIELLFNGDISSWDVSSVSDMNSMFDGAKNFNQDLGSWHLSSLEDMRSMLDVSGLSIANYEATLNGWSVNSNTPQNLRLGALSLEYCDSTGRLALIDKGWTIEGDSKNCMTSNSEITLSKQLNVYPNPASDKLHISGEGNFNKLTIRSILGQEVLHKEMRLPTDEYDLDIKNIQTGIYIITVTGDGIEESQKIEIINE